MNDNLERTIFLFTFAAIGLCLLTLTVAMIYTMCTGIKIL